MIEEVLFGLIDEHKKRGEWNWTYVAISADELGDNSNLDARFMRWLSEARVYPHEAKLHSLPTQYRWYTLPMPPNINGAGFYVLDDMAVPLHACLPSALYNATTRHIAESSGSLRSWYAAFFSLYGAYRSQAMISKCPARSLKCPYCGLVQDEMHPAFSGELLPTDHTQCWHCDRYFERNDQ